MTVSRDINKPFLTKSPDHSNMSHYEAYLKIEDQKERMQVLVRTSLVLSDRDKDRITGHIMELHSWLTENRKVVQVQFDLTPVQLIEYWKQCRQGR